MAILKGIYIGGPCDTEQFTMDSSAPVGAPNAFTGVRTCGGTIYELAPGPRQSKTTVVYWTAADVATYTGKHARYTETQFPAAWHGLMHTLAHKGPNAVHRIAHARARIKRLRRR